MTLSSKFVIGLLFILGMQSCIGDDIIDDRVPAQLRITNPISELKSGDTYQLEVMYTNIIGKQEATEVTYLSSDESLATISSTGLITNYIVI